MFSSVQRTTWYNGTVQALYEKTSIACSNVQTTCNSLMTPCQKIVLSWWKTLKQWHYLYIPVKKTQKYYSSISEKAWTLNICFLTLDWTSALWSFWSSKAADLVSSLRAAMWSAGRRTLPFVSCSSSRETTWLWPCCRAMARGVKPSYKHRQQAGRD